MSHHQLKPLLYPADSLRGISEQVVNWHHQKHQAGYVAKRNEIEEKLKTCDKAPANQNYSEFGELKRRETFNASGMILHEIYWENMGGDGQIDENSSLGQQLVKDCGAIDAWKEDFIATAKASLGWAILCYDPSDSRLHNYLCDLHNYGAVWGAIPLIALDVFEHAYYHDYGPDRAKYLEDFLSNLHWERINARYEKFCVPLLSRG